MINKKLKNILAILGTIAIGCLIVFYIYFPWQNYIKEETARCEDKVKNEVGENLSGLTFDQVEFWGDIFVASGHYYISGDIHYFHCSSVGKMGLKIDDQRIIE